MRWRLLLCAISSLTTLVVSVPANAIQLYFTQNGAGGPLSNVLRVDTLGGTPDTIQSNLVGPFGVAVDIEGGMVYWTDTGTDSIQRKNLDGSGSVEDLITTGLNDPHGIALDVGGGKMYFADRLGTAINLHLTYLIFKV